MIAGIGVLAFLLSASISCIRVPVPNIHDEFSYLLAADTFAHGRLTNPTHPMWEHFETFHVIHQPSYASKYPPAQGFLLAAGQLIGHSIVGVWFSTALAAAAVTWMLAGWLPSRWTLLGGLLFTLHTGIQFQWGQSYWGGAIATIGGALLFGSLVRAKKKPRSKHGFWLGVGIVILAFSRPFEGLVACLCVGASLLVCILRGHSEAKTILLKIVLPAAVPVIVGGSGWAYYNLRVTGNPLTMPYQIHEATYCYGPVFLFQTPHPEPEYRHSVFKTFRRTWAMGAYDSQQSLSGFVKTKGTYAVYLTYFYFGVHLSLSLLALPWMIRSRRMWFAVGTLATTGIALLTVGHVFPHYVAPVAPLLFLLVVQGLRYLRTLRRRPKDVLGRFAVPVVVSVHVCLFMLSFAHFVANDGEGWQWQRDRLLSELENASGQHLVMVGYADGHNIHQEWVYNEADIDAAKVVWAREMAPATNSRLYEFFPDRTIWFLDADSSSPQLVRRE